MNKIKFIKNHKDATAPRRAHISDSGYDIVSAADAEIERDASGHILYLSYNSGISIEPPDNVYFLLYPRSSVRKYNLLLCNSVGVIDTSYRGDVLVCFRPTIYTENIDDLNIYKKGDRIAQLIPRIRLDIDFVESSYVRATKRGCGGFGSSGE